MYYYYFHNLLLLLITTILLITTCNSFPDHMTQRKSDLCTAGGAPYDSVGYYIRDRPPRGILIDVVKSLLPTKPTTTTTEAIITDKPVKEEEIQCISGIAVDNWKEEENKEYARQNTGSIGGNFAIGTSGMTFGGNVNVGANGGERISPWIQLGMNVGLGNIGGVNNIFAGIGGGSGIVGQQSQKTDVEPSKTKLEKIHESFHEELEKTHKTVHQVLGIGETFVDKHLLTHHYTNLPKEIPLCPTDEVIAPPPVVTDPVPSSSSKKPVPSSSTSKYVPSSSTSKPIPPTSTSKPKDKEPIEEGGVGVHGEGGIDVRFGAPL